MSPQRAGMIGLWAALSRRSPAISSIYSSGGACTGLLIDFSFACGTAARNPS